MEKNYRQCFPLIFTSSQPFWNIRTRFLPDRTSNKAIRILPSCISMNKSLTSRGGLHCGRGEKKVANQWSGEKTYNIQRCLRASEEGVTLSPRRWRYIGRRCAGEPPGRLRVEKARSPLLSFLAWADLRDTMSCPPRARLGVPWSPWGQQEPVGQLSQHRAMHTMLPKP